MALYREWRPQRFADLVGQGHVTRTLQNAVRNQRVAHAYLFSGPRGTGKTSAAKIFAKALNCEHGPAEEPCNACSACTGITQGRVMDVVEIDAASNRGVDEIRELREQVRYAPTEVRMKVYIVDEVHMLTTEAFNALLKTLEEPPEQVVFILATTEPHRLPATIISRCQRFDFRRISMPAIIERMREIVTARGIEAEEAALWLIARAAEGGLRDALSVLDQALSFCTGRLSLPDVEEMLGAVGTAALGEIIGAVKDGDVRTALSVYNDQLGYGKDVQQLLLGLVAYVRDALFAIVAPEAEEVRERLAYDEIFQQVSRRLTERDCAEMIDGLTRAMYELRSVAQGRLVGELAIIQLCMERRRTTEAAPQAAERTVRSEIAPKAEPVSQPQKGVPEVSSVALEEPCAAAFESESRPNEEAMRELASAQALDAPPWEAGQEDPAVAAAPAEETVVSENPKPLLPQPGAGETEHESRVERAAPKPRAGDASLEELLSQWDDAQTQEVMSKWAQISAEVKKKSVTVQAWLAGGEPVAKCGSFVVCAFKNQIHRETVLKPNNRSVIEEVLTAQLGEPIQLVAVPLGEWQEAVDASKSGAGSRREVNSPADDLFEELVTLFGPDKVHSVDE